MRNTIWIFILIFLLTSCNKDQDQVIPEITNEWNLIVIVDGLENEYFSKINGYYNPRYTIVKTENYSSDSSMKLQTFEYNDDNQIIRYFYTDFGEYKYYYENGLRVKREFLSTQNDLASYQVYEFEGQKISKTYSYYNNDILYETSVNYYNGINIDSTYHYYSNDFDSIKAIKRFKYDGSNNLLEEEYWYKRLWIDDSIVPIIRRVYEYENNVLKREEYFYIQDNSYKYIFEYYYDIIGRKTKQEIYGPNNTLLGYYNITYSSNTEKYIIPEL